MNDTDPSSLKIALKVKQTELKEFPLVHWYWIKFHQWDDKIKSKQQFFDELFLFGHSSSNLNSSLW